MSRVLLPLSYTGTREKKGNVFLRHISHSFDKLQGRDLNPRPPGYEPDELPDCSTLRQVFFFKHPNGRGGTRTLTLVNGLWILSPVCLPIPPLAR